MFFLSAAEVSISSFVVVMAASSPAFIPSAGNISPSVVISSVGLLTVEGWAIVTSPFITTFPVERCAFFFRRWSCKFVDQIFQRRRTRLRKDVAAGTDSAYCPAGDFGGTCTVVQPSSPDQLLLLVAPDHVQPQPTLLVTGGEQGGQGGGAGRALLEQVALKLEGVALER